MLTIPALIVYYTPPHNTPEPTPPNVTKTINLIDPTGTKVQTWNYTGLPISINYQDPKGVGTLLTTNGLQVILNDQPVYAPIGWYLQIQDPQ